MSLRLRFVLLGASVAGLAALLLWGLAGLPNFGDWAGSYGLALDNAAVTQRHATNVVAAIVWDYRGLDTMGEELILFAAVMGTTLLLREARGDDAADVDDQVRADTIRAVGLPLAVVLVLVGLFTVAHGVVTPGGGFQGGVILAGALLMVYLVASHRAYRRVSPTPLVEFAEGLGIGGYIAIGLAAMGTGAAFLTNILPLGQPGTIAAGGTIMALNVASATAVSAAFALLFAEFLEEVMLARARERRS